MELVWYVLVVAITVQCNYLNEHVTGCSSKCAVTTDKDLTCFNTTLDYYEKILFGLMRNYIAAQLNFAARSPNRILPSRQQMVASTLAQMERNHPLNIEDEKGLLTIGGAQPIVEALVDNTLANNPGMYVTSCPQGCEHSRTPWIWWFTASAVANVFLVTMAITFMMLSRVQLKQSLHELKRVKPGKAAKQH